MLGFRLFWHALAMIFRNFRTALKVSVVPFVLLLGIGIGAVAIVPFDFEQGSSPGPGDVLLLLVIPIFILLVVPVILIWIAVGWHRAILLNEAPAMLWPRWQGAANWQYFKSAFVYFLVLFAIALPAYLILLSIFPIFDAQARRVSVQNLIIVGLFAHALVLYFAYRFGPVLPSAALGHRMTLGQAWQATSGANAALLVLIGLTALLYWVPAGAIQALATVAPALAEVLNIAVQWVLFVFGISILTTLYGYFVEKRPLS